MFYIAAILLGNFLHKRLIRKFPTSSLLISGIPTILVAIVISFLGILSIVHNVTSIVDNVTMLMIIIFSNLAIINFYFFQSNKEPNKDGDGNVNIFPKLFLFMFLMMAGFFFSLLISLLISWLILLFLPFANPTIWWGILCVTLFNLLFFLFLLKTGFYFLRFSNRLE